MDRAYPCIFSVNNGLGLSADKSTNARKDFILAHYLQFLLFPSLWKEIHLHVFHVICMKITLPRFPSKFYIDEGHSKPKKYNSLPNFFKVCNLLRSWRRNTFLARVTIDRTLITIIWRWSRIKYDSK